MGGQGGQLPTQVLADQLTLSQPGGQMLPLIVLLAHPALGSFLQPCCGLCRNVSGWTAMFQNIGVALLL